MNRIKEVPEEKRIMQTRLADLHGKSNNMEKGCIQNRQYPRP